jgi:enoyl-CoA hydratase/carnithine racemase
MDHIQVEVLESSIGILKINRPEKNNIMSFAMFRQFKQAINQLDSNSDIRVIIITGQGDHFTAGLDASDISSLDRGEQEPTRFALKILPIVREFQDCFSSLEKCKKPVISLVHGSCISVGLDIVTACDIRYAVRDAIISANDIQIAITNDVGTLQRLPKIVNNQSWVRELVYTGRNASSQECYEHGLFSRLFDSYDEAFRSTLDIARNIAAKSPFAIYGCKTTLNHARDHSVQEGLDFVAYWNIWAIQAPDITTAYKGKLTNTQPEFPPI